MKEQKHPKQNNCTSMNMLITFSPSWFVPNYMFSFIFIILYGVRKWYMSTHYNLPPSPPRLPVIGNLHQVMTGKNMHQPLLKLSQKYGPAMLLHFGSKPFLAINSSEMASEVLKANDLATCTRPYTKSTKRLTYNYMDVAFAPYGDHWKDMRKILVSDFVGAKRSRLSRNIMEIEVKGLLASLLSTSTTGSLVNLNDMLKGLVHDHVSKVAFGKSYRGETFNGRKLQDIIEDSLVLVSFGSFSDYFPTFGWIIDELSGWNRRLDKCFSDYDGFFQMIIDGHTHNNATTKNYDGENDFVADCISRGLTSNEIKGILANVLNGGIESSSGTMVWAMSELIKNPRVMQKLQTEIRTCVGRKSRIEESDIAKMPYLKMVVKETLRLHTAPAFLLPRECIRRCQIGGYDVLPGTKIMVNVWGIGRDPKVWSDNSNEFYPERFENLEVEFIGKNYEMVSFGGGRRACPGYQSSITIIEYTIANLLYWFDWEPPFGLTNKDLDMEEDGYVVIRRKTPLCAVPVTHKW